MEPDEFLRGLDEPPEVLRSMDAFLADRRDFDPSTWDADQEAAARATVVEQHSKRLTPVTRPHVMAGSVGAMFGYDPLAILPSVEAPIVALAAADDDEGTSRASLVDAQRALAAAGRPPIRVVRLPDAGHNLMRYRPREVVGGHPRAREYHRPMSDAHRPDDACRRTSARSSTRSRRRSARSPSRAEAQIEGDGAAHPDASGRSRRRSARSSSRSARTPTARASSARRNASIGCTRS